MQSTIAQTEKPAPKPEKKRKRRRTRAEKVGRLKYIIQRLRRLERKIDKINLRTRQIMVGIHEWVKFEPNYIEELVCKDEVDARIIELLIHAGEGGVSSPDLARDLAQYDLKRWTVTRRIQRMNRTLLKELNKKLVEYRGRKWAASSFAFNVWGLPEEEVEAEFRE